MLVAVILDSVLSKSKLGSRSTWLVDLGLVKEYLRLWCSCINLF